jgi:hypothetical protein
MLIRGAILLFLLLHTPGKEEKRQGLGIDSDRKEVITVQYATGAVLCAFIPPTETS